MKIITKKISDVLPFVALLSIILLSCGGDHSRSKTNNTFINEEERNIFVDKDSFLNDKQGEWICSGYEIEDVKNRFAESYAKEFTKYAYFTIFTDTLSAVGMYNTPVYSYKYPVSIDKYDEESVFITTLKIVSDSLFFIAPLNPYEYYWENSDNLPYYKDAPMNRIHLFLNDNFIINDRGYFFFFKRGKRENGAIKGVTGDNRNYFRVEKSYGNVHPKEILPLIEKDFPHGFEQVMDDVNKEIFLKNDWDKNSTLMFEKSQSNGKFIMKFAFDGARISLLYYLADDIEDESYPG